MFHYVTLCELCGGSLGVLEGLHLSISGGIWSWVSAVTDHIIDTIGRLLRHRRKMKRTVFCEIPENLPSSSKILGALHQHGLWTEALQSRNRSLVQWVSNKMCSSFDWFIDCWIVRVCTVAWCDTHWVIVEKVWIPLVRLWILNKWGKIKSRDAEKQHKKHKRSAKYPLCCIFVAHKVGQGQRSWWGSRVSATATVSLMLQCAQTTARDKRGAESWVSSLSADWTHVQSHDYCPGNRRLEKRQK